MLGDRPYLNDIEFRGLTNSTALVNESLQNIPILRHLLAGEPESATYRAEIRLEMRAMGCARLSRPWLAISAAPPTPARRQRYTRRTYVLRVVHRSLSAEGYAPENGMSPAFTETCCVQLKHLSALTAVTPRSVTRSRSYSSWEDCEELFNGRTVGHPLQTHATDYSWCRFT